MDCLHGLLNWTGSIVHNGYCFTFLFYFFFDFRLVPRGKLKACL